MANLGLHPLPATRRQYAAAACLLCSVVLGGTALAAVEVRIEGLDGRLRSNAEAALSIRHAADQASENTVRRLHNRAEHEIRRSLEPFGYYSPTIETSLEARGADWQAVYRVKPGPRTRVDKVDVKASGPGRDDQGFRNLVKNFPVKPGAPLDHTLYEQGKRQLRSYAARKGYFEAEFDSTAINVHVAEHSAEVIVHLASGPRYRFGPVSLHQDVLDDDMVSGYVTIEPGQPYDAETLIEMQGELSSGNYFQAVEIQPRTGMAEDLQVPLDITLVPAKPRRYEIGVGYGTDTGYRGKINAQWRRLNRRGHHAETTIEASQREHSSSTRYNIPWPYPSTRMLSFFTGVGRFAPRWASTWRVTLGASYGHSRGRWREVLTLAYENESFTIADRDGSSSLVIPSVNWTCTRSNNLTYTTRGQRIRLDLRGAHDDILSSVTFLQVLGEAKFIRSLGSRVRVLVRGSAARTFTDRFDDLPPNLRFVTGGDQTVRGYGHESLGPRNDAGLIIGGNSLLTGSLEMDYRLARSWAWGVFADTGNALDDFSGQLYIGAGTGVRWISPIGIVRLDGAFGLSRDGTPFRLHLAIGPDL